jgi:ribosomal protein L16 Arg81 hydroxylase
VFDTSPESEVGFCASDTGAGPKSPTLDWLIEPVNKEQFFSEYFERHTLVVHRDQPDYFANLLTFNDVDRVLTTMGRGYPEIVLKDASKDITADHYTTNGKDLDVARVAQLFAEGSSITLAYLDSVLPKLTRFCRKLESEFSCPFQTNIYVTPPGAQGARPHYDTHDVFVLQISGSKRWTIFDTPVELPLPGQEFDPETHRIGAITQEFELHAGDVAYVPRGVSHEARSTDDISLHITVGILRYTWADLLLEFVAGASLRDPALRKALPPDFARTSFDRESARMILRGLLERAATSGDFDDALDHFVDRFLNSSPPLLEGQLVQTTALATLTLDSLVGVRDTAIWRLEPASESFAVRCGDHKISFPSHAEDAVRYALGHPRFTVRDLPSSLDNDGKLTLVRRLAGEGLLMVHARR